MAVWTLFQVFFISKIFTTEQSFADCYGSRCHLASLRLRSLVQLSKLHDFWVSETHSYPSQKMLNTWKKRLLCQNAGHQDVQTSRIVKHCFFRSIQCWVQQNCFGNWLHLINQMHLFWLQIVNNFLNHRQIFHFGTCI